MSSSTIPERANRKGRDISVSEFRRSELSDSFNILIDTDLILISNRNLHLKAVCKEFLEFSRFITQPSYKEDFLVFLTPVFQNLYFLLFCQKGMADAKKFIEYFKYLPIDSDVLDKLLKCKTSEDLEDLAESTAARLRVKLSRRAYDILMTWLKDQFSESSEMFIILRVLHENFFIDLKDDDTEEEEFSTLASEILQAIDIFLDDYNSKKGQTKFEPEIIAETSKASETDDDEMTQKMSELDVTDIPETPERVDILESPESAEILETPENAEILETPENAEILQKPENAEILETPESVEILETPESVGGEDEFEVKSSMFKLRDSARKYLDEIRRSSTSMSEEELVKALLNPPDPVIADSSVEVDEKMNFLEDPGSKADESAGSSPLEVPLSPLDSEYVICSEASNERNEEDDFEAEEDFKQTDQEMMDVTSEDAENIEEEDKTKYFKFKESYKSNFHSAYPLTICGKDVLCSSDVSSDLHYVACAFKSFKICTWRLGEIDLQLQPIGTLRGHKSIVYALSIDSNLNLLISGSHDGTIRLWNIEESKFLYEISTQHSGPIYDVCASPNSRYFLSSSEKEIILFWYDNLDSFRTYVGHSQEAINCVRFHPNCCYFAAASSDGDVFLFKINENCPVRMFDGHIAKVYTLSFSPCGKHLATADVDGILIIWDILTCLPIDRLETGQGIRSISYDISGSFIAVLFYYKSWKLYNVKGDKPYAVITAESAGVPKSVHFSIDNKMFIVQFCETDKNKIPETEERPMTTITMENPPRHLPNYFLRKL